MPDTAVMPGIFQRGLSAVADVKSAGDVPVYWEVDQDTMNLIYGQTVNIERRDISPSDEYREVKNDLLPEEHPTFVFCGLEARLIPKLPNELRLYSFRKV